jgi:hypothetical protein
MVKRRNKSDGERTYPMTGRVPLMDVASWQEEGVDRHGVVWVATDWGEKNKQWSESVFGFTPYRAESGTSVMSHGWSGHVRWSFIIEK